MTDLPAVGPISGALFGPPREIGLLASLTWNPANGLGAIGPLSWLDLAPAEPVEEAHPEPLFWETGFEDNILLGTVSSGDRHDIPKENGFMPHHEVPSLSNFPARAATAAQRLPLEAGAGVSSSIVESKSAMPSTMHLRAVPGLEAPAAVLLPVESTEDRQESSAFARQMPISEVPPMPEAGAKMRLGDGASTEQGIFEGLTLMESIAPTAASGSILADPPVSSVVAPIQRLSVRTYPDVSTFNSESPMLGTAYLRAGPGLEASTSLGTGGAAAIPPSHGQDDATREESATPARQMPTSKVAPMLGIGVKMRLDDGPPIRQDIPEGLAPPDGVAPAAASGSAVPSDPPAGSVRTPIQRLPLESDPGRSALLMEFEPVVPGTAHRHAGPGLEASSSSGTDGAGVIAIPSYEQDNVAREASTVLIPTSGIPMSGSGATKAEAMPRLGDGSWALHGLSKMLVADTVPSAGSKAALDTPPIADVSLLSFSSGPVLTAATLIQQFNSETYSATLAFPVRPSPSIQTMMADPSAKPSFEESRLGDEAEQYVSGTLPGSRQSGLRAPTTETTSLRTESNNPAQGAQTRHAEPTFLPDIARQTGVNSAGNATLLPIEGNAAQGHSANFQDIPERMGDIRANELSASPKRYSADHPSTADSTMDGVPMPIDTRPPVGTFPPPPPTAASDPSDHAGRFHFAMPQAMNQQIVGKTAGPVDSKKTLQLPSAPAAILSAGTLSAGPHPGSVTSPKMALPRPGYFSISSFDSTIPDGQARPPFIALTGISTKAGSTPIPKDRLSIPPRTGDSSKIFSPGSSPTIESPKERNGEEAPAKITPAALILASSYSGHLGGVPSMTADTVSLAGTDIPKRNSGSAASETIGKTQPPAFGNPERIAAGPAAEQDVAGAEEGDDRPLTLPRPREDRPMPVKSATLHPKNPVPPARRGVASHEKAPPVRISIGKVVVQPAPTAAPRAFSRPRSALSLAEYLSRRQE